MKRIFKFLCVCFLFGSLFLVGLPSAYASYNSKYLTEKAPSDYYSNLNTSLTGEAFRRNLSAIISKNYNAHNYKTNNEVLAQTDPDPKKNGNIICFYTGQSLSGGWNKEHVWAKSHGFPSSSAQPYCDAHHLRPTLSSINSSRSNSDFGELDGVTGVSSDQYGNRWTGKIFEPRDEVKGDVARIMFYMATRYGFQAPYNLTLVDTQNTTASDGNGRFGGLQTLLKWHYEDPVSSSEIYRNNVIFDDWQHNRNPYIDHPEYVDLAWPNEHSSGGGIIQDEVDYEKVNHVMTLISSLPVVEDLTLSDKSSVEAAKASYDDLTILEKDKVYNYDSLQKALNKIKELENGGSSSDIQDNDPTVVTGNVAVDFKNHGLSAPSSYSSNQTFKIGDHSFYASAMGVFSGELRIGGNKNLPPAAVDSKYGLSSVEGVVLEQLFDVKNAKSLTMTISNHFGNISKWYVLFKETGKTSYELVQTETVSECPTSINVELSTPKDGRFAFIFSGDLPRVVLSNYEIGVSSTQQQEQKPLAISSSILAEVHNDQLTSAYIRFGGKFDKSLFDGASRFGVIVYDDTLGDDSLEDWYDGGSLDDFIAVMSDGLIQCKMVDFSDKKAIVNEEGQEDPNGNYYQFGLLMNVLGLEKTHLRGVIYLEKDGEIYFTTEIDTSFYNELEILKNDTSLTDNESDLVQFLLQKYQD